MKREVTAAAAAEGRNLKCFFVGTDRKKFVDIFLCELVCFLTNFSAQKQQTFTLIFQRTLSSDLTNFFNKKTTNFLCRRNKLFEQKFVKKRTFLR